MPKTSNIQVEEVLESLSRGESPTIMVPYKKTTIPIKISFGEESATHYDAEGNPVSITLRQARKFDLHKALGHELGHIERKLRYGALPETREKKVKFKGKYVLVPDEDAQLRDMLKDELWAENWAIKKRGQQWTPRRLASFITSCAEIFQYDNYDAWKLAKPVIDRLGISSHTISKTLKILKSQPEWPEGPWVKE